MKIDQTNKCAISLSQMIASATLNQLNCAVKNLKGGKKHVLALIGPHYFQKLQHKGKIQAEDSKLYADIEEKSGNALRMVVTIFTSGLGIWMGLADFLASGHRSWQQLMWVSIGSLFIGTLISFLSYRFADNRAKKAVLQKKMLNLQAIFINKMLEQIEKKLVKVKKKLYEDLLKLDSKLIINDIISFFDEKDKEKLTKTGRKIVIILRKKMKKELAPSTATSPFSHYLFNTIFKQFKEIIMAYTKNASSTYSFILKKDSYKQNELYSLFKFPRHFTHSKVSFASWLIDSSLGIFLEAIPVLVGTFGAIFLFLNGLPDTFKKLGYDNIVIYFDNAWLKNGSFCLAILLVVYLAASQVKFSYKSYLRTKHIEDAQSKVAEKEVSYSFLSHQYRLINKFSKTLEKLINMLILAQAR